MSNTLLFVITMVLTSAVHASQRVVETVIGVVAHASCDIVAQDESLVGGVVGGAMGGVGGNVFGSMLGGRTGGAIGALAGGALGASVGSEGPTTYRCAMVVTVDGESEDLYFEVITQRRRSVGSVVRVLVMSDGTHKLM